MAINWKETKSDHKMFQKHLSFHEQNYYAVSLRQLKFSSLFYLNVPYPRHGKPLFSYNLTRFITAEKWTLKINLTIITSHEL